MKRLKHDYEPGTEPDRMSPESLCRICGETKKHPSHR